MSGKSTCPSLEAFLAPFLMKNINLGEKIFDNVNQPKDIIYPMFRKREKKYM